MMPTTNKSLLTRKLIGVTITILLLLRSSSLVNSPNLTIILVLPSCENLTRRKMPTMSGRTEQRAMKMIVRTEFVTSKLVLKVMRLEFMSAHMQIIRKDSFRSTI